MKKVQASAHPDRPARVRRVVTLPAADLLDGLELADGWPSSSGIGIQIHRDVAAVGFPDLLMYGNASEPVTWAW